MSDNNGNGDKDFFRDMAREMVSIARENSWQLSENTKVMGDVVNVLEEIKTSLQSKPCIVKDATERMNKGWKDKTLSLYQFVIATLFTILIGILTAFGFYK